MKFSVAAIILGVAFLASAEKLRFDNFKVYRVVPQSEAQRDLLASYEENSSEVQKNAIFFSNSSRIIN